MFVSWHSRKQDPKEGTGLQVLATEKALDTKLTFQLSWKFCSCHVRSEASVGCLQVTV